MYLWCISSSQPIAPSHHRKVLLKSSYLTSSHVFSPLYKSMPGLQSHHGGQGTSEKEGLRMADICAAILKTHFQCRFLITNLLPPDIGDWNASAWELNSSHSALCSLGVTMPYSPLPFSLLSDGQDLSLQVQGWEPSLWRDKASATLLTSSAACQLGASCGIF